MPLRAQHVIDVECGRFADPRSRRVEQLEQGLVPQRLWIVAAGGFEHRGHLLDGDRLGKAAGQLRRLDLGGDVGLHHTLLEQESMEIADRGQHPRHGGCGERRIRPRAQLLCEGRDVALSDALRRRDAEGPEHREVAPQIASVCRDRVGGEPALDCHVTQVVIDGALQHGRGAHLGHLRLLSSACRAAGVPATRRSRRPD